MGQRHPGVRSAAVTLARCVRIARSARCGSCAAIASTISACSWSDCSGRRLEDRPILKLDQLGPEQRAQARDRLVVRGLDDRPVQPGVCGGHREQVTASVVGRLLSGDPSQRRDVVVAGDERGVVGREALERRARLEDLDRLGLRHEPHARAAIARADDEAVVLEPDQGPPDRRPADAEMVGQVLLDEPCVRRQQPLDDLGSEATVGL